MVVKPKFYIPPASINYGKLAEQYGSFLVAIAVVSITVLALVMYIWHLERSGGTSENRSAVIKALIIAIFSSFVGAHLLAEAAAFIDPQYKGFGKRPFLLASVNIFIAVPVVMFAITILAREYKKQHEELIGLRKLPLYVFQAVVFCVLWWMVVSIFVRMPPEQPIWSVSALLIAALTVGVQIWRGKAKGKKLLADPFGWIIFFSVISLLYCSWVLSSSADDKIRGHEAFAFGFMVTFTCLKLWFWAQRLAIGDLESGLFPSYRAQRKSG